MRLDDLRVGFVARSRGQHGDRDARGDLASLQPERLGVLLLEGLRDAVEERLVLVDDLADGVAAVRVVETVRGQAVSPLRAIVSEPSQAPSVTLGDGRMVQVSVASHLS